MDETRVNHLRDVLTQFQTHEVDQVERSRTSAESCLNALLNLETADEIKTFAVRVQEGRVNFARRPSAAEVFTSARPQSAMGPPPTPPPRLTRDVSSQQRRGSDSAQNALTPGKFHAKQHDLSSPDPVPEKKAGALKRLGTVMRRKDKAPPPVPSSAEKRKEKGRSLMPFRRGDSSRSFHDLEATGQDFSPISSRSEDPRYRQSIVERIPTQQTTDSEEPAPVVNGVNQAPSFDEREEEQISTPSRNLQPQPSLASPQELSAIPSSPANTYPFDPISRAQQEAPPSQNDELGRNLTIRDKPIQEDESEAQQALSNMASQLRMQAQTSGLSRPQGSVRGRRDVRNTMFMPSMPPQDLPSSTTEQRSTSTIPEDMVATGIAAGAVAGGVAIATEGVPDLASPIKQLPSPAPILEDRTPASAVSDTTSVHSAQSLSGVVQHPELTSPGLNASIIETINTSFAPDGNVDKSFAIGEIALAYNPPATGSDTNEESIRLSSFQLLEKVAVNPTFATAASSSQDTSQSDEDRTGEYLIAVSSIRRPQPTVALKYQLHLDPSNLAQYSPLLLAPAWQCQEGQASVIVVYGLNPAFHSLLDSPSNPSSSSPDAPADTLLTLRNVVVSVSLDQSSSAAPSSPDDAISTAPSASSPPKATTALMKPMLSASFRKRAGSVVWRLGTIHLTAADVLNLSASSSSSTAIADEIANAPVERKLLVRFMTTAGVPKRGTVEVKFDVVGRTGSVLGVMRKSSTGLSGTVGRVSEEKDPFADDGGSVGGSEGQERWEEVPTSRKLMAGRYTAA